jgi:alanine racemase
MDMTMVDVTGLNAKVGDDVIVFNDVITIEEIAQKLGTIPYEILTSVNERVKRVFFSD